MNDLNGKEWLQNSFSIWRDIRKNAEEKQINHPAMFPEQLCEKLIRIYTKIDDKATILDPFMGAGSTLLAAIKSGRDGVGIELSEKYFQIANERLNNIQTKLNQSVLGKPTLINGDSRFVLKSLKSESIDLCINSPPYWDILNQKRTVDKKSIGNYSDELLDIGNINQYEDFILSLKDIYSEVYRILKPNKRCCIVVMDIRKKDKFYPLHIDITNMMREIGFELEEFVIWDRQHEYNNMKTLGYPYVFRFNKVHEYICIYWKR